MPLHQLGIERNEVEGVGTLFVAEHQAVGADLRELGFDLSNVAAEFLNKVGAETQAGLPAEPVFLLLGLGILNLRGVGAFAVFSH